MLCRVRCGRKGGVFNASSDVRAVVAKVRLLVVMMEVMVVVVTAAAVAAARSTNALVVVTGNVDG